MLFQEISELYQHKYLIKLTVRRELLNRYRNSFLGLFWAILHPLIYVAVLNVVFSFAFKRAQDNFIMYVLTGILFWMFFTSSTTAGMNALFYKSSIIKKNPVKKSVFVLTAVFGALINWTLGLIVLFVLSVFVGHIWTNSIFLLPVILFSTTLYVYGIGLVLSVYCIRFRDLQHLYTAGLTLLMYMTPIFYYPDIVPERLSFYYSLNPNLHFVQGLRYCVFGTDNYTINSIWLSLGLGILSFIIGLWFFRKKSRDLVFYL